MPWIQADYKYPDSGQPAHYEWLLLVLPDDIVFGYYLDYAKEQRKKSGQLREEFLSYQKLCGQKKDFDTARYFREEAAELQKKFRGWDSAIKIIEGDNDWKHGHVTEPIAPYVDWAFREMSYA